MNVYLLVDVVVGVLFSVLAIVALVDGGHRRYHNRLFAALSVFLLSWMISNQISTSIENPTDVAVAANYVLFASSFAATLLVTKLLIGLADVPNLKKVFKSLEPLAWLIVLVSATPLVGADVEVQGEVYGVIFGPAVGVYAVGLVALLAIAGYAIFRGRNNNNLRARNQVRIIGKGLAITGPLALLLGFLIPYFTNNFEVAQISLAPLVVLAMCIFQAIIRHGLFDIRLVVVRTAAYALSIATLACVYFGLAYLASITVFRSNVTTGLSMSPVNIALAIVLALVFQPIKQFFDHWTNRIFYRDRYDENEFITRLGRVLTSTTELNSVLELAAKEISSTLKASGALFIIYRDHHEDVMVGARRYDDFSESEYDDIRQLSSLHSHTVFVVDSANPDRYGDPSLQKIHRIFSKRHVALVLPLISNDETIGYLLLGEQMGSNYTQRDVKVLETIADSLVIAIQNARAVQAVRDLNTHLEQKINNATRELRASNKRLIALDEVKDEFMSMASHQLRTPLTSVKGYISMVLEGDAGKISTAQRHLLEEAFTSSERMVHLIGDFLNVSRLQTGKFIIDRKGVDLAIITAQEVQSMQQIAGTHDVKINYRKPSHFPMLYLDEGKIRQVIMNFIDNAVYYSPESKSIKVTLSVEDGDAVLRVIDSGMGVPKEAQDKLFTKFFRADNARKQRPDGTGVGLFLAKQVVDGHDGALVFESEEGKGSTFGFRLPIKKLSEAPLPEENDQQNSPS